MRRLLLCAWIALAAGQPAAAESLKLFADIGYPPLVYLDKGAGKPAGQLVDLLAQAEALTGDRYTVELMPWVRAYQLALRGQGGLLGATRTPEREPLFDFSAPLLSDDIHVVSLRSAGWTYRGLDDLRDKRVGGVRGTSYGAAADQAAAAGQFILQRDNCQRTQLRRLLLGQLDAALVGNGALGFELQWRGHRELAARHEELLWHPVPLARSGLHVAFPKALMHRPALDRLDAALARLQSAELRAVGEMPTETACAE